MHTFLTPNNESWPDSTTESGGSGDHFSAAQLYAYVHGRAGGMDKSIEHHTQGCPGCMASVAHFKQALAQDDAEKAYQEIRDAVVFGNLESAPGGSAPTELAAALESPPSRWALSAKAGARVVDYPLLDPAIKSNVDYAVVTSVLDLKPPEDIAHKILQEHHAHVTPEQIHEIVQAARTKGKLVYTDEADLLLGEQIKQAFGLQTVKVVRCTGVEPVMRRAAEVLRTIIWDVRKSRRTVGTPPKVRVGIAGGPVTFNVMSTCGYRLEQDGFDGEVVVDAMLPGAFWLHMAFGSPQWPRFSFQNFWGDTPHLKETNYGGHYIPPMVTRKRFQELMTNDEAIQDIVRSVNDLDIILTSGARWDDPDAAAPLKRHFPDQEVWQQKHGIVGELLWHPISPRHSVRTDLIPMTSLGPEGLERLPSLIQQGKKRVVAILGPCHACKMPKTPLVIALLLQHHPLITDIVMDANTAQEVVANPVVAELLKRRGMMPAPGSTGPQVAG